MSIKEGYWILKLYLEEIMYKNVKELTDECIRNYILFLINSEFENDMGIIGILITYKDTKSGWISDK